MYIFTEEKKTFAKEMVVKCHGNVEAILKNIIEEYGYTRTKALKLLEIIGVKLIYN